MTKPWTDPDPILVEVAEGTVPGRVLDVGCGGGHDALWLARQGWSVAAIDTSRHSVSKVNKLAREAGLDVTAVREDVTALTYAGEFDLVSVCYMHLLPADRSKMLACVTRALKPAGTLLFRSFEASIAEAPFDRDLLPSRADVIGALGPALSIQRAEVADEDFPYLKQQMRLLTVVATRPG